MEKDRIRKSFSPHGGELFLFVIDAAYGRFRIHILPFLGEGWDEPHIIQYLTLTLEHITGRMTGVELARIGQRRGYQGTLHP